MKISSRLSQNLLVGFVVLVLVLSVLWGTVAGSRAGKSAVILKNALAITQGLSLFYNDQNRYPTGLEFANQAIMLEYFTVFPFADISGGPCEKTFSYYSPNPKNYELSFCLPKAADSFSAGVNKVSQPN